MINTLCTLARGLIIRGTSALVKSQCVCVLGEGRISSRGDTEGHLSTLPNLKVQAHVCQYHAWGELQVKSHIERPISLSTIMKGNVISYLYCASSSQPCILIQIVIFFFLQNCLISSIVIFFREGGEEVWTNDDIRGTPFNEFPLISSRIDYRKYFFSLI